MGKCLSCCRETNESNHINNSKDVDETREELSGVSLMGEAQTTPTANLDQNTNANSKMVASGEKRTLYTRIPPILSGGSGGSEGKKAVLGRDSFENKTIALFEQYKDPAEESMLSDGIERFCQDLEVRPEEFKVLVLAWKFGAETMCQFTRQEFLNGCKLLKANSIKGIQSKFPDLLQEVQDPEKFKELYRFTFMFGLDTEIGQRSLPSDMAISLWRLVFSQQEPPILKRWLTFLDKHPHVRGIPRDTWNMFLNFCEVIGDDLSTYDATEAWPSLFDDFIEYENDQTNQNVHQKDMKEDFE